ncbi:LLM class flavin-dependent oxidoreductase [Streptomyces sp. 4N509B]|uniref:LLM class flavin-dependent oxidoreductase n=1 Tax=Streptomyces sp. 4N509B TaxID=3457413 RepID=UPI003FD4C0F5
MRVGLMFDLRYNPAVTSRGAYLRGMLEMAVEAERLGFDAIGIAQHHGHGHGDRYGAGLLTALASLATVTHRIRIGSAIAQIGLGDPVVLAEELAELDHLCDGRLDVGVGAVGPAFDDELRMFGRDPASRPTLFAEALDLIVRCWTDPEPFDHDGPHWPGRRGVRIPGPPSQQPHPPVWVAAPGPRALRRAARLGHGVGARAGFLAGLTGREHWQGWWEGWVRACGELGRPPKDPARPITAFGTVYVCDDPDRARALHGPSVVAAADPRYRHLVGEPRSVTDLPHGQDVFVTPARLREEVEAVWGGGHAPDEVLLVGPRPGTATTPGMSWEAFAEYCATFARTVLPVMRSL